MDRAWAAVFMTIALVPAGVFLFAAATQPLSSRIGMLHDDAYFYLGVARHLAAGHGSTFNGIEPTNGYHPLWLLLVTALARVTSDRSRLVLLVQAVSGVVWSLTVLELYRIGKALHRQLATAFAAFAVVATCINAFRLSFNGMESGLVVLTLVSIARSWLVDTGPSGAERRSLSLKLAVLVLCRLDMVFLVGAIVIVRARRARAGKRLLREVFIEAWPAGVVTIAYLLVNLAIFQTPLPVSAQAKGLGAPFWNAGILATFLHRAWPALLLGAAAWEAVRRRPDLARWRPLMAYVAALWGGTAIWLLLLATVTSYGLPPWYLVGLPALMVFSLAVLADAVGSAGATARRILAAGTAALLCLAGLFLVGGPGRDASIHDAFVEQAPADAARVDALIPAGAVMAMGDRSGAFGYFSHHPLVQLEGLVASAKYLHALRTGQVHAFLAAEHVNVYLRSEMGPGLSVLVGGLPALRFVEPFQGRGPKFSVTVLESDRLATLDAGKPARLDVFRYRPELNP